ncbi:MAG TPA: RNA polymerase sigma factor [Polyangiaceae bacterium]|nr:RNA polymerase sigma factor [Polyangiaceae bacterium]
MFTWLLPRPDTLRLASPSDMDEVAELRPAVRALVARLLRRPLGDPDVEDCTHEALRRALEGRPRAGEPLRPWLLGVARHVALDALRGEYRRRARLVSERVNSEDGALWERSADPTPGPEGLVDSRERLELLGRALAGLPPQQREALELLHVEGLGYREIAERLGVPMATVGTWILRARQGLQERLNEPREPSRSGERAPTAGAPTANRRTS